MMQPNKQSPKKRAPAEPTSVPKTIVLVGLMGAGKTCIGRRLAARLNLPFVDADAEIEVAAGCSIEDIFDQHGETAFRDGERRVIARLLDQPRHVLATGGGAFINEGTRQAIKERAISIWLSADLDLLLKRTARRQNRPLLKKSNPRATLQRLIADRYPAYAEADIKVDSIDGPPDLTVDRVVQALTTYLGRDRAFSASGSEAAGGSAR